MVARKKEKKNFRELAFWRERHNDIREGGGLFFYFPPKKRKEEVITTTNDTKIVCVCMCSGRPSAGNDTQR